MSKSQQYFWIWFVWSKYWDELAVLIGIRCGFLLVVQFGYVGILQQIATWDILYKSMLSIFETKVLYLICKFYEILKDACQFWKDHSMKKVALYQIITTWYGIIIYMTIFVPSHTWFFKSSQHLILFIWLQQLNCCFISWKEEYFYCPNKDFN